MLSFYFPISLFPPHLDKQKRLMSRVMSRHYVDVFQLGYHVGSELTASLKSSVSREV